MEDFWSDFVNFFNTTGWKILLVISLLIVVSFIIKFLMKGLQRLLYKTTIDNSVVSFVVSILKIILWILLIFSCASILELSTSSLIVCLSSLALAIGLALKDSFANLTNGLFIIYNKSFKRGDHIRIDDIEGKVQNIKLLSTELITFDNRKLIIPNSKFTTESIVNYTALPTRRIDMKFSVAYGLDMDYVEKVLLKTFEKTPLILSYPKTSVFISEHGSSSVEWTVWTWVATEDYWTMWKAIPKIVYQAFEKADIDIPFNQLDVHFENKATKPKKLPPKSENILETSPKNVIPKKVNKPEILPDKKATKLENKPVQNKIVPSKVNKPEKKIIEPIKEKDKKPTIQTKKEPEKTQSKKTITPVKTQGVKNAKK